MTGGEHGSGFAEIVLGLGRVHRPGSPRDARRRQGGPQPAAGRARSGDLPGRPGAGGRRHACGVPRVRGIRRPRLHRGSVVLQRQGRTTGRRGGDLDLGRRRRSAHAGRGLRLRGCAPSARGADQGRRVPRRRLRPADRETVGASLHRSRPARTQHRRAPSRSTCSWKRATHRSRT